MFDGLLSQVCFEFFHFCFFYKFLCQLNNTTLQIYPHYSGTVLDLPYRFVADGDHVEMERNDNFEFTDYIGIAAAGAAMAMDGAAMANAADMAADIAADCCAILQWKEVYWKEATNERGLYARMGRWNHLLYPDVVFLEC